MTEEMRREHRRQVAERAQTGDLAAASELRRLDLEEEERRKINEDPRTIAAVRRAEERERREEAEAEQRIAAEEEGRRQKGRDELEAYCREQANIHFAAGGDEASFRRLWPSLEEKYFQRKADERDRARAEGSVF